MLDPATLEVALAAHQRLQELEGELERAKLEFHRSLRSMHAAGASLREIADRFGISHQRVHQIVSGGGAGNRTRGRGVAQLLRERLVDRLKDWVGFERFDSDARTVVRRAQDEAGGLGHAQVGTEHVLLGLAQMETGAAARILRQLGVEPDRLRAGVVEAVGSAARIDDVDALPLTPRARKVFERSLREALDRDENSVGTEHILLGLMAEQAGLAARLLREQAVDRERVCAVLDGRDGPTTGAP